MFVCSTRALARFLSAVSLSLLVASTAWASPAKLDICHIGDGGEVLSLGIGSKAMDAHLRHGDYLPLPVFADGDGDGFGAGPASTACTVPVGYVEDDTDCDDSDPAVNPGADEICNGIDDDCDGATDEGAQATFFLDDDGDGYGDPNVSTEACTAPAGYVGNDGDCDDDEPLAWSGAAETPGDGVDNDCNPATPDVVDCPCAQLFPAARTIWEGVIGGAWTPSLLSGSTQSLCVDNSVRTPGFLATDITWAEQASGSAGRGCYAVVREDLRDRGGDVVLHLNTLIPYSLNPVLSAAQQQACRSFIAANCIP